MKDSVSRFHKIMNLVIINSYPWLKPNDLWIIRMNLGKYSMGVFWLFPNIRLIFISPKRLQRKSDSYLSSLFAHELAHFERSNQKGWIRYLGWYLLHLISSKAREQDEKATDMLTIKNGYGKSLYQVAKSRVQEKKRFYLSPAEIKAYAKKLGKW